MQKIHPKKILLTSPHNLGDFVAKVPFIRLIKRRFSRCKIVVCARSYIQPLVEIIPEVDEFIPFETFFSQSCEEVVKGLEQLNADVCLHVLNVHREMGPDVIAYAQKARIPYRLGNIYRSRWKLIRKNHFGLTHNLRRIRVKPDMHEFEWNLLFLTFFGYPFSNQSLNWTELLKTSKPAQVPEYLKEGQFNLVIHPGSLGNAKEWKGKHYLELIEQLDPRIHVLITGTLQEKDRFDFSSLSRPVTDLRGQLSLKEFIALIAHAQGLIAPSTGPIHIASLFSTPTIALFPPDPLKGPNVWGPKNKSAKVLQADKLCEACRQRLVDFDPKLCTCMEGILVDDLLKEVTQWNLDENFVR